MSAVNLRPAVAGDAHAIAGLVNAFAADGIMLARRPDDILLAIEDYIVAVDEHGHLVACGALREYAPSLAEVAAIAVAPAAHGRGLGREIVAEVERLAQCRGIGEVFALTLVPRFFESLGYRVVERSRYPEKVRRDCLGCTRRFGCAEVCVQRMLDRRDALEVAA